MANSVYKTIELAGSSPSSIQEAIDSAVERIARTEKSLRWLEVTQIRGMIENGRVSRYQVVLKVGASVED